MLIRRAWAEDEHGVFALLEQFPSETAAFEWQKGAGAFHGIMENSALGAVLVAEEEKRLLGVITLSYPFAIRCAGRYACIEEFIVDEAGRGKGVGGKLITAAIEEARSRGCHEVQVNRPSEAGYPVYLRHGWKDLGRHLNLKLQESPAETDPGGSLTA